MRRAAAALLLLAVPGALLAQAIPETSPAPGAKVRVTVGDQRLVGTLTRIDPDSLIIAHGGGWYRLAVGSISRLEVGARRSRVAPTLVGTLLGVAAGAGLGAVIGGAADDPRDESFGPDFGQNLGVFFGGIAGGITGMVVGYNRSPWRWTAVALPRVGINAGPGTIGVTLSF